MSPERSVFPDKKIAETDYKQAVTEIQRQQEHARRTEYAQGEATWLANGEYPDLPVAVTFMTDIHFGSKGVDYDLLDEHVKTIMETPNMFVLMGGDIIDAFNPTKHPSGISGDAIPVDEQLEAMMDLLTTFDRKGKLGAFQSGNHDCLDETTEIFTKEDGWITYDRLKKIHNLLTINPDTTGLEWHKYDKKIVETFSGYLNRIKTNTFDIFGTDNHRVFYRKRKGDQSFSFINLSSFACLKWHDPYVLPASSSFNNKDFDIKDIDIKIMGWLMTDGYIQNDNIKITQSKPKIIKKITLALDMAGVPYFKTTRKRKPPTISGMQVVKAMEETTIGIHRRYSRGVLALMGETKKELPKWLYQLSDRQFDIFLGAVIDGDGTKISRMRNCSCVYQKDKAFIDGLQALCIMHGYRASIYKYKSRSGNVQHRLNITHVSGTRLNKPPVNKKEWYEGVIWDVSIPPNRNFLVRRNGKAYFTGNSWSDVAGYRFERFLRELNCPIYAGAGNIDTIVNGGQKYRIYWSHTHWGNSKLNISNAAKRALQFSSPHADIALLGHVHQSSAENFDIGGEQKVAVVGGTYKRKDSWAGKWGMTTPGMPGYTLLLWPDQKRMDVIRDPQTARQVMRGLIQEHYMNNDDLDPYSEMIKRLDERRGAENGAR